MATTLDPKVRTHLSAQLIGVVGAPSHVDAQEVDDTDLRASRVRGCVSGLCTNASQNTDVLLSAASCTASIVT